MPRIIYAIPFEYTYDMDDQGIFYYISTKGNFNEKK